MNLHWIDVPNITDPRGNLAVLENRELPFEIKRIFYLYDVPSGGQRGGHALQTTYQLLIPLSGSFELTLKDGKNETTVLLNSPIKGVLIAPMTWREMLNFSAGAVCLVLASKEYSEEDYIREWELFRHFST